MAIKCNDRSLQDWLTYIESFHPNDIELGLERITKVAIALQLLETSAKVILVGGTNGKGSCVATLESLALNSELNIGCYTSPHLLEFNERIRINGRNISDQALVKAFEMVNVAKQAIPLTFFEFTTLSALWFFKQQSLDLIVLEVGLGGRLDAVNIVEPDAAIITTIDYDHQSWLGDDLKQIAYEKSGIYRVQSINLIGDESSYQLIKSVRPELKKHLSQIKSKVKEPLFTQLETLMSDTQINPQRLLFQNIQLAFALFEQLYPQYLNVINPKKVIKAIKINARFQQISQQPNIIVDVAHNAQAAVNLKIQISSLQQSNKNIAICGLLADKAIDEFISNLEEVIDLWIFVDLPVARAAKSKDLQHQHQKLFPHKQCETASSVKLAYQLILEKYRKIDEPQIFVIGSFYTVAEMMIYQRLAAE